MKLALYLAVCCFALSTAPALAQDVNTSRWKLEQNKAWGFAISLPSGWTILDMPMGNLRLAVRQDLSGGHKLMCQVHATFQPETAGLSQGQLNAHISGKGPPSPQELSAAMTDTGFPSTVYSSTLEWVNGYPAYVYEGLMEVRSATNPSKSRALFESIYVPGKTYGVNCMASSDNIATANHTYNENLPTFRGFLRSFIVVPQVVN